jgi:hypothetical protein
MKAQDPSKNFFATAHAILGSSIDMGPAQAKETQADVDQALPTSHVPLTREEIERIVCACASSVYRVSFLERKRHSASRSADSTVAVVARMNADGERKTVTVGTLAKLSQMSVPELRRHCSAKLTVGIRA